MINMLNFKRGKTHKDLFNNPEKCKYKIGDKVEFLNKDGIWVNAEIIGFNIKSNMFQAILKCDNKRCKKHFICVGSIYLRKIENV